MIALALIIAGSFTVVVNTFALRDLRYPSAYSFNTALLDELGIRRATVVEYIRQHPEELFDPRFDEMPLSDGRTVREAAQVIQQRPIDEAVADARRWSFAGLIVLLVGAVGAAWALAGGILRPIRRMTARARSASVSDLGERVSAGGPNDEIRELADTFDSMLDRLAAAFDAQRHFASQVAHELRTPLATSRTEIAMLLDDTTDPNVRSRLRAVGDAVDRGDRLVSRLLVLSRADLKMLDRSRFALDELVGNVLGRVVETPAFTRLLLDLDLRTAEVECDRALVESLVRNLLDNSGRHNRPDGWVRVSVRPDDATAQVRLSVANSTAAAASTASAAAATASSGPPGPPGTGLSIVNAVLQAHGGTISWSRVPGEVTATVTLPAAGAARTAGTGWRELTAS